MTQENQRVRHGRELLIEHYVLAFDRGDEVTMAEVIKAALADPTLDRLLIEVNEALYAETGLPPVDDATETVQALLREFLPSAYESEPPEPAPLTVDDVARQLVAEVAKGPAIPPADAQANQFLVGNRHPLPDRLTPDSLLELARQLGMPASQRYWDLFQRAALALRLSRQNQLGLAAARRQRQRRAKRQDTQHPPDAGEEGPA